MGHERTFRSQRSDVRIVPIADSCTAAEDMRLLNDLICGREQLRARHEWPSWRRAGENRDERAPLIQDIGPPMFAKGQKRTLCVPRFGFAGPVQEAPFPSSRPSRSPTPHGTLCM